jgi:Ca-activated chloride channel family protein
MFPAILFLIVSITSGTRWKRIQAVAITTLGFFLIGDVKASDASNAKQALADKKYEVARDAYHQLAEKTKSEETQARYRLGEATAAYRAEDFRNARTAYSQSLLSSDPQVQANGHLGMGNSLFQLGWKGLSGESYPADPNSVPDLDRFDTIVKEALAKLAESDSPEEGDASDYVKIESLVTNWADAVRHYDSAAMRSPSDKTANQNRNLTITYLKRLEELLDQEKKEAEQAMAEAGQGPPQPGEGDGEGEGEAKEGEKGKKGPKKPGGKGEGEEDPQDGSGDEGDKDKDGKSGKDKDKKDGDKGGDNPNESPQDRAKRILKENADLEKGPLTPGRREFRDADKDW